MKRIIIFLIFVSLLISGCAVNNTNNVPSEIDLTVKIGEPSTDNLANDIINSQEFNEELANLDDINLDDLNF